MALKCSVKGALLREPGWLSSWANAFGSGHDPAVLESSPPSGSPQGVCCFSLCLGLCLGLMNKIFEEKKDLLSGVPWWLSDGHQTPSRSWSQGWSLWVISIVCMPFSPSAPPSHLALKSTHDLTLRIIFEEKKKKSPSPRHYSPKYITVRRAVRALFPDPNSCSLSTFPLIYSCLNEG